jgi:hypothetical protein
VIGPDGSPLTMADLPAPGTKRWVIRRKAEVIAAVRGGLLSLEEACSRYMLTVDEFLSWQSSIDQYGLAGLRTTRIQQYRQQWRLNLAPSRFPDRNAARRQRGLDGRQRCRDQDCGNTPLVFMRLVCRPYHGLDLVRQL